jgi:hypothetical protein
MRRTTDKAQQWAAFAVVTAAVVTLVLAALWL